MFLCDLLDWHLQKLMAHSMTWPDETLSLPRCPPEVWDMMDTHLSQFCTTELLAPVLRPLLSRKPWSICDPFQKYCSITKPVQHLLVHSVRKGEVLLSGQGCREFWMIGQEITSDLWALSWDTNDLVNDYIYNEGTIIYLKIMIYFIVLFSP